MEHNVPHCNIDHPEKDLQEDIGRAFEQRIIL